MGIRTKLHALIDTLPDADVAELHELAEARQRGDAPDPFADMSDFDRQRLRKSLEEGEAQLDRGEGISADEARRRLRSM